MTNPVNSQFAALPAISITMVDSNGNASSEWYRFFLAWWQRDGGPIGITGDAQETAQTALHRANDAFALAALANSHTSEAADAAAAAQTTANLALQAVGTVTPFAFTALQKSLNLSDIPNPTAARTNLGAAGLPLPFWFATLAGQSMYMPVTSATVLPAGLVGIQVYAAIPPAINATFTVQIIRTGSGAVVPVGTVTILAGTTTALSVNAPAIVQLSAGDALQVIAPTSSGAQVGLTLRGMI